MQTKKKSPSALAMILDENNPLEQRRHVLARLCMDESEESLKLVEQFLQAAAASSSDTLAAEKLRQLNEILAQLERGPLRSATFLKMVSKPRAASHGGDQSGQQNGEPPNLLAWAKVIFDDGVVAYSTVLDAELAASLRRGDTVLLDGQAKAVLMRETDPADAGEEAVLDYRVGHDRLRVALHDQQRRILRASQTLIEKLDAGEAAPGDTLLVCTRRLLAFDTLPRGDRLRYLVQGPVPDVVVDRDIGAPPAFLSRHLEHVRMEMLDPESGRRYRLQRAQTQLLVGMTGTGKTLAINGLYRALYEVMSELTGVPVDKLPPRVFWLRNAAMLSMWFGQSEKNYDEMFNEVERVASQRFTAPDGREWELPTLVICEEADGLARQRGGDAIYDRVQTTLLQRLDMTNQKLRDKLIIFIFTTNVPELLDPAFLRRAGGQVERFGRLGPRACAAVLGKLLSGVSLRVDGVVDEAEALAAVKSDILPWLFSDNGHAERGLVELGFVGSTEPTFLNRRDFLTGAVVSRAIQEAAREARRDEWLELAPRGVTSRQLMAALDRQIGSIVDLLNPINVGQYVTLPDGTRVGTVRRITRPHLFHYDLERNGNHART